MDYKHIIDNLAKEHTVEDIINNVSKEDLDQTLKDLAQDIYQALLEREPSFIEELYSKDELRFFITRMVLNNVNSKTSPYYYNYKLPQRRTQILDNESTEQTQDKDNEG